MIEKKKMTSRQRFIHISILIIGVFYIFVSNQFVVKLPSVLPKINFLLFLINYILILIVMFIHSILYFNWLFYFISNILEVDDNLIYNRKDKDFSKNKYLLKFKRWVNER